MDEKTFDAFAQEIANYSDAQRLAFAKQLKKAKLWTGDVSSTFNTRFYTALLKLDAEYKAQVSFSEKFPGTKPAGRIPFLATLMSEGSGGSGTSKTTKQTYVTSKSQTAKLVNTVAQDLLGRDLTKAEQSKYLKFINAAQVDEPAIQTNTSGSSFTRGGVDEEQILKEQISQTGEARTKRATDAYALMMQELGGLQ